MPLADTQVRNAKPREKQYKIADGRGLFLVVTASGSKYWGFRYTFNNKEKLLALRVYSVVTLANTREKRNEVKKLLANDKILTLINSLKSLQKTKQLKIVLNLSHVSGTQNSPLNSHQITVKNYPSL